MIRVNLLSERKAPKQKASFLAGQGTTLGCSLILIGVGALVGVRFLSLRAASSQLETDLLNAQKETARLRTVLAQVQQFEAQKGELQQRVSLIEQLRQEQVGPVHMLDEISKALPPLMWLTALKQTANEVLIDGRGMTMTGLSDFVSNLEASGYFERSVEIVSTTTETNPAGELIKFQIKAIFKTASGNKAAAAAAPAAPRGA